MLSCMKTVTLRVTGDQLPTLDAEQAAQCVFNEFDTPSRSIVLAKLALAVTRPHTFDSVLDPETLSELEAWHYLAGGEEHNPSRRMTPLGRVAVNMIEVNLYKSEGPFPDLDVLLIEPFVGREILGSFLKAKAINNQQPQYFDFRRLG